MCIYSMNDRKCPFMGPRKRCKGGYHLSGTVAVTPSPEPIPAPQTVDSNPVSEPRATPEPSTLPQPQAGGNVIIDPANLKDFLGKLIREEMAAAMSQQSTPTLNLQPQQPQPQPPPPKQPQQPPQPQPQRHQMAQHYRIALIGELLSRH